MCLHGGVGGGAGSGVNVNLLHCSWHFKFERDLCVYYGAECSRGVYLLNQTCTGLGLTFLDLELISELNSVNFYFSLSVSIYMYCILSHDLLTTIHWM